MTLGVGHALIPSIFVICQLQGKTFWLLNIVIMQGIYNLEFGIPHLK